MTLRQLRVAAPFGALLVAGAAALVSPTPVRADSADRAFRRVIEGMDTSRRLQFCAFVAEQGVIGAATATDPERRAARAAAGRQLEARLATRLAEVNAGLTADELQTIERENQEAMGLLTFAPSADLLDELQAGAGADELVGLFATDVGKRCDALLDRMRVPPAPPVVVDTTPPAFRWFDKTGEEVFADTGLAPFARLVCSGAEPEAEAFAGAPWTDRGANGESLLDFAMACRDQAAFTAILAAGFSDAGAGAFGDPPVVQAAEIGDPAFLAALLARGFPADAMGRNATALSTAFLPGSPGGGEAFSLLRAAGASLNFPDYDRSMWDTWATYARWGEILDNWSEFDSDPVRLGRMVTVELGNRRGSRSRSDLEAIAARLEADFGVCFPVVGPLDKDERGFSIQPDCPA